MSYGEKPKRNREVVTLYTHGYALKYIASEYGISADRVRQIVNRAKWIERSRANSGLSARRRVAR